ncbi:hypothetical protein LFZ20_12925 [Salmonella enterica subsp. enterica serovar Johannesburg str. SA20025782]|nr:hypothetical protein LFZ20_12925 [Salmonella enterica subsp. enterica serovar Johannesburg str. SA20025782]
MVLPIFTHSFTFSFLKRFQVITVVKTVCSCLALRHKTGGSANYALPIKKLIITEVKQWGRSTRIKPVFVFEEMVNVPLFQAINEILPVFHANEHIRSLHDAPGCL